MSNEATQERNSLADKTVCIATFTMKMHDERTGRTIYWRSIFDYFCPRARKLFYIEQPLSYADDKTPTIEVYQSGKLVSKQRFPVPRAMARIRLDPFETSFRLKSLDIVSTILLLARMRTKVDFFLGIEPINGFIGIVLRTLGIANTTIYCIMDYAPKRFDNPFMNGIFHALDRISVRFSDFAWNTCAMVEKGRRKYDGNQGGATQLVVPVPCPTPYTGLELAKGRNDVVYIGTLRPAFGVDLLVRSFRRIADDVPTAKLHMIGDGPLRSSLEEYIRNNNLVGKVRMHGMLSDKDADMIIAASRIGVAPYLVRDSNSGFIYADNAKVKLYIAYGLPVIVTKQVSSAAIIEGAGAGLLIRYSEEELAISMKTLLTDEALYERLHSNALNLASELRPDRVFRRAIEPALVRRPRNALSVSRQKTPA